MNKIILTIFLSLILIISGCTVSQKTSIIKKPIQNYNQNQIVDSAQETTNSQNINSGDIYNVVTIKIPYILYEDNGKNGKKIGCNDSLAFKTIEIPYTNTPLAESYSQLFLMNADSYAYKDLKVESASIQNGKATIALSGEYSLAGVCDDPRFENVLKETALQFSSVSSVELFINNKPLDELLSSK